jgi:hypothetical protein
MGKPMEFAESGRADKSFRFTFETGLKFALEADSGTGLSF